MPYKDPEKAKANVAKRAAQISEQRKNSYRVNAELNRAKRTEYYLKNKDSVLQRQRTSRQKPKGWVWHTLSRLKFRARQLNLPFSLTKEDFATLPEICPVFGVSMPLADGSPYAASVDRIDNTQGYVSDNIVVMSSRANRLKRDATLDEMIALGEWAKKQKDKLSDETDK